MQWSILSPIKNCERRHLIVCYFCDKILLNASNKTYIYMCVDADTNSRVQCHIYIWQNFQREKMKKIKFWSKIDFVKSIYWKIIFLTTIAFFLFFYCHWFWKKSFLWFLLKLAATKKQNFSFSTLEFGYQKIFWCLNCVYM